MSTTIWPTTVEVRLDAEAVKAAACNRNGLTYKGFGVLSGNATSSLLLDYKAEQPTAYWRMVETLFGGERPLMNTVKIEMGNDRNNSTGPNVATMRDRDDYPSVASEPGFQLASDACRYNPNIKVSLLRWMAPTWVHSDDDVYRWYKNTILAAYREYGIMVDSVNPDVNERTANLDWVAEFAHRAHTDEIGFEGNDANDRNAGWHSDEERELFHRIKIITSDEEATGTFAGEVIANPEYLRAMDIASYHYSVEDDSEGNFKRLADEYDKEVWNSEAQATFSNSADRPNNTNGDGLTDEERASLPKEILDAGAFGAHAGTGIGGPGGPLEMANTLIKGFVDSRRTHAIYQPAIGACYEHMEYASKELLSMRDPWDGWIYYDAGCVVLEHFAKFANFGWEPCSGRHTGADMKPTIWRAISAASRCEVGGNNPVSGARRGEPSYMTLSSPDGKDFSTVIVNDSAFPKTYRIIVDARLEAAGKPLYVWQTKAQRAGEGYSAQWRRKVGNADVRNDAYEIHVEPWSIVTVTTLNDVEPCSIPTVPEKARKVLDADPEHGILYADAFDGTGVPRKVTEYMRGTLSERDYLVSRGGNHGATARYTTDSNGAFEIVPDAQRGHALRQQIDGIHAGNAWIEGDPRTTIGDMRWTNYTVSVDVCFEEYPGRAPYVLVGARDMGGNKFTTDICAYDFKLRADGVWLLRRYGDEKKRGHYVDLNNALGKHAFPMRPGTWFTLSLAVAGPEITVWINGRTLTSWTDDQPQAAGRVDLGSSFDHVRFSNLKVERIPGFSPYYSQLIDDMHILSWDDTETRLLRYSGEWLHLNGQGMFTYMRSISRTSQIGASLTCVFEGTGLDVLGPSDGNVRVDVFVDDSLMMENMALQSNEGSLRTQLRVDGLEDGHHKVTVKLANAREWDVDAIGILA
jgi:hypothetical protein